MGRTIRIGDDRLVNFVEAFDPAAHKIASVTLTDKALLKSVRSTGRAVATPPGDAPCAR